MAAAFTCSLFVTAFITTGAAASAAVPVAFIALVLGGVFWPLYGRLYDSSFNRRLRRVVTEQAGDERTWICEVELRREGVWSRSRGIELLFDWHQLSAIEDRGEAIEFHFRSGFVMVRNRAFAAAVERERFVETAHRLAA